MTGDTTTVLIGLGLISLTLPVGFLILFRANRTIEREHPFDLGPALPRGQQDAEIPTQRPAAADETVEPTATPATPAGAATG